MALQLIISAGYQKAGSLLKVSVNGTYGWQIARATYGYLKVTFYREDSPVISSGPVIVHTIITENMPIGIESNGAISQDGGPAGPVILSKKISSKRWHKAWVLVEVYNKKKIFASEFVHVN